MVEIEIFYEPGSQTVYADDGNPLAGPDYLTAQVQSGKFFIY